MSIISIILLIIQYGPTIFSIVSEIVELIRRLRHPVEQSQFKMELEEAVEHYRRNKDRSRLRDLRTKLQRRCFDTPPRPAA